MTDKSLMIEAHKRALAANVAADKAFDSMMKSTKMPESVMEGLASLVHRESALAKSGLQLMDPSQTDEVLAANRSDYEAVRDAQKDLNAAIEKYCVEHGIQ